MSKRFLTGILAAMMLLYAAAACAKALYVDNRETDKLYPERLNLRAEPSVQGDLLGLYYSGTPVQTLEEENDGYVKVEIGGMTGYMAAEYLISEAEAKARYGEESDFFTGRAAQVDLSGMWMTRLAFYEQASRQSEEIAGLESGTLVELLGIIADEWAYIAAQVNGERRTGYVVLDALTDVDDYKALIIAGEKADSRLILYSWPNTKAKELMSLKNGTACFNVFGRGVGGWRKVRVGGVTGWIRELYSPGFKLLSETERASIPYYPLLMQTKKDALLYSSPGDLAQIYMTLGKDMKVELLAESGEYAFVRTYEGSAGAYDCGDYGYIALSDLSLTPAGSFSGLAQVDDGDLPAVVLAQPDPQADLIGALCAGAQVRVTDYTQTDYVQIAMGSNGDEVSGYVLKSGLRMLTGAQGELTERIPQRAVLTQAYTLRSLPDAPAAQGDEAITLAQGERVYMLGVVKGWAYVRAAGSPNLSISDGTQDQTGFVDLSVLNAPASTTHLTAFVNTDKVNMRKEGSAASGIVAKARTGERLRIADYGTEWTCVVTPEGNRGYLMTKYLEFEQE